MADWLPPGTFVVVSGPPASGKTTLARAIAPVLGLPLIAKDTIKQALMTVLPVPGVETSRIIGAASVAALLAVAAESGGAVLESVWHRSCTLADLRRVIVAGRGAGSSGRSWPTRPWLRGWQAFVVAGAAAVRADPGESALADPAAGQNLEGVQVIGAPDDFQGHPQGGGSPGDELCRRSRRQPR